MAHINVKDGIRKNFIISKSLNDELVEYAEKNFLSQNQVAVMALNQYFMNQKTMAAFANMAGVTNEEFKNSFADILVKGLKNEGLVVPSDKL